MKIDEKHQQIQNEFAKINEKYPQLSLSKSKNNGWVISGRFSFRARYKEIEIEDTYQIKVIIPASYPDDIPSAFEVDERIPKNFHQNY